MQGCAALQQTCQWFMGTPAPAADPELLAWLAMMAALAVTGAEEAGVVAQGAAAAMAARVAATEGLQEGEGVGGGGGARRPWRAGRRGFGSRRPAAALGYVRQGCQAACFIRAVLFSTSCHD
jgi:hypothetical protein